MTVIKKTKTKFDLVTLNCVAGLDVSTKMGVVILNFQGKVLEAKEYTTVPIKNFYQRMQRMQNLYQYTRDILQVYTPKLAVIEGYSFSPYGMAHAAELGAAVRMACFDSAIPAMEVAPTALKKFIVGTGKAHKKNVIMMNVLKKWGFEANTDNIADAFGLARIGLAHLRWVKAVGYEQEVLNILKTPQ